MAAKKLKSVAEKIEEHKKRGYSSISLNGSNVLDKSGNIIPVSKNSDKIEQLKTYLSGLKLHPQISEHHLIAKSFGVFLYKPIFREDAINRFIKITFSEPTTSATVSKLTGIKQKYLCQLKRYLEKIERIKVVDIGRCPTTFSQGVQFLSSNPQIWKEKEVPLKSNQIKLF